MVIFTKYKGIIPSFAIVDKILVIQSIPLLVVSELKVLGRHDHYRAYKVAMPTEDTEVTSIYNVYNLPDHSVMHLHQSYSQTDHFYYVCLKWNIETSSCVV